MKKLSKILLMICPLLFIGAGCEESSSLPCETEGGSVSFVSISSDEDFKNCDLGAYNEDQFWIIDSFDEFEKWNESRNCQFSREFSFDESTLLIGYLSHPNSGIELESEQVVKNCDDQSIIDYNVNFKILKESFSVLTTVNYGIVISKQINYSSINLNVTKDENNF